MNLFVSITLMSIYALPFVSCLDGYGAEWIDTTFEQFPFMVNIKYIHEGNAIGWCGGSIISKSPGIILTAGHCIVGGGGFEISPYDLEVWIGCTRSDCTQNDYVKKYGISHYKIPDEYENKKDFVSPFDIGLLYLDGPITQAQAQPISLLPSTDGVNGGDALRGLGYYGRGASDMDTLETHWTHIVPNSMCDDEWGDLGERIDTICVEDMDLEGVCGVDKELQHGLCYRPCSSGYYGVGPVCWGYCPSGYEDHGATCYKSLIPADYFGKQSYGRRAGTIPIHSASAEEGRKQGFGPGDSGSPVVYEYGGKRYQIGLVSAGSVDEDGIPKPMDYQILTSVVSFYDWIYEIEDGSSYSSQHISLGCYKDSSERAMVWQGNGYETPLSCGTACTESGYKYFALQYPPEAECFCSNDLTHSRKYGESDQCENGRGGAWANSIYTFQ